MREFLVRGTQAEKKGAEESCLPINIKRKFTYSDPNNIEQSITMKFS
jgi:hypothetical protein